MQDKLEKRKFYRWIKKIVISYSTLDGEKVTELAISENICEAGMQFLMSHKLEIGESVEIGIELIDDPIPITATCKVIHLKPAEAKFNTGLQFTKIEDFQRIRLIRYLKR